MKKTNLKIRPNIFSVWNKKKNRKAWETMFHKTRFDISKLAQWERIFEYAETKGMFLHFKTHETETNHLMDKGVFGVEGKLYYRELIARFGHDLSMNWNLGEENQMQLVKWAITLDEPGKAIIALLPDDEDPEHNYARGRAIYGTLFAGGFGVGWYFGYASPNTDLTCQDFRSRNLFWNQNKIALLFFDKIYFWEMVPKKRADNF